MSNSCPWSKNQTVRTVWRLKTKFCTFFLSLDVPILHLIPVPFPDVWHKIEDNGDAVDYPTVEKLNKILRVFVSEFLELAWRHGEELVNINRQRNKKMK